MGLKLNTASGGSVSIEPTNTASNYTLTVPAQTGTVIASDSSGNVGIGNTSPANLLAVGSSSTRGTVRVTGTSTASPYIALDHTNYSGGRQYSIYSGAVNAGDFNIYDITGSANRFTIDSSGNLGFNSGYGSVATAYGCRAWVNFNGQGTVAIRASGNVSSITDNGAGDYTVNFTNAMPDINYTTIGSNGSTTVDHTNWITGVSGTQATGSVRIAVTNGGTADRQDRPYVFVAIFR